MEKIPDYDYLLSADAEDGGIGFYDPDSPRGLEMIEWVRQHGISPDWCSTIRLVGDKAILRLGRYVETSNGRWALAHCTDGKGNILPVYVEHVVSREGFPEVSANEVIQRLSANLAKTSMRLAVAREMLHESHTPKQVREMLG